MHAPELRELTEADLAEAGALLAARHRAQRAVVPALDPSYEQPPVARTAIEELWRQDDATGTAAVREGRVVGYLVGIRKGDVWGPNAWVEGAGYAATEPETIRDLYAHAAAGWVADGRTSHYVVVPATDAAQVDAWTRVGFGHQHAHAIRDAPREGELPPPREGLVVRRATRDDIAALARLELELPAHQMRAPTFSPLAPPTLEEARREWEDDWDDPRFTTFVVEHSGRVIGSAVGCPIEVSSSHTGPTRPPGAAFLGFAAVLPEARGLGAGRALGVAVLEWAREGGYPTVVTDWRVTNLLSSRTWPRLGWVPTFYRLHRAIG